jgi:phosphatidylserine/phosphatidylglycerophosphate/cardiolipin synthase-like enzyme
MSGEIDGLLEQSFQDYKLSRGEKQALVAALREGAVDARTLGAVRASAFRIAREQVGGPNRASALAWLEEVCQTLISTAAGDGDKAKESATSEACFTPGFDAPAKIAGLFRLAAKKVDVCVFTITDNIITKALLEAHRRKVAVRIITDNDKAHDRGSDIAEIQKAGVAVRIDRTEFHMHHKFAIFDDRQLVTGSYNWTRGAAEQNHENFVVTTDAKLKRAFAEVFEKLWKELA